MHFRVEAVFVLCEKKKKTMKKNWNFGHLYLKSGWRDLLQIWNVASSD